MKKTGKKLLAVAGAVMMFIIVLVFGFTETEISGTIYFIMWSVCAAAICYGTDTRLAFK